MKEVKKPIYCEDELKPPYKLCWVYALYIKDFEKDYCMKCQYYRKTPVYDINKKEKNNENI